MKEYEKYNVNLMPLSANQELRKAQEKIINGIPLAALSVSEKRLLGRDHPVKQIDGYELKPDCCYRAICIEAYNAYLREGFIYGDNSEDEYVEFENNKGVNWFLGGVCLKYGEVIIECPAYKEYFVPTYDYGCHLSFDPYVRHMKSSGYKKPVPMSMVKLIKHPYISVNLEELNNSEMHR